MTIYGNGWLQSCEFESSGLELGKASSNSKGKTRLKEKLSNAGIKVSRHVDHSR
jgi:hypothetical protein